MTTKTKLILSIAILSIVAIIIYIFSANCVWLVDDIHYQFNMAAASNLQRINSIGDIFASQWVHYFSVNGRYIAHWLVQLFCGLLGQKTFAICNALIYIVYISFILKLAGTNIKNTLALLSASLLTLIANDTIYGPACQIGFIWTFVLVFIWLNIFFNAKTNSILKLIFLFFFSIIAGNGQEAISIGISGSLIIYAITNYKQFTNVQWASFFGFGIGSLILCLTPAAISRADNLNVSYFASLFNMLTFFRVFYIFITILIVRSITHKINFKIFYQQNSFYINAILILIIFNFTIGVYGNRQLFGIEALSIILILRLLKNYHFNKTLLFIITIFIVVVFFLKWNNISHSKQTYNKVFELYKKSDTGIIFYDLTFPQNTKFTQPTFHISYSLNGVRFLSQLFQSQESNTSKELKINPTCLQNINDSIDVQNQVVKVGDGCYVVIQSKENPAEFTLKRTLDLYIYHKPHSDFKFSWVDPMFEGKNYNANIIYQDIPFVTNDSIIIE